MNLQECFMLEDMFPKSFNRQFQGLFGDADVVVQLVSVGESPIEMRKPGEGRRSGHDPSFS